MGLKDSHTLDCPNGQARKAGTGDMVSVGQAAALGGATVWPAMLAIRVKTVKPFRSTASLHAVHVASAEI